MSTYFKLGDLRKPVTYGSKVSACIGQALLRQRVALQMSREKVAQAAGVSKGVVKRLERGEFSPTVERVADVLESIGLELTVRKREQR